MAFGQLASYTVPIQNGNHLLYTSDGVFTEGRLYCINANTFPVRIRVAAIGSTSISDLNSSDYLIYNQEVGVGERFVTDMLYLKNGESLVVKSDLEDVSFSLRGRHQSGVGTDIVGIISAFSPVTNVKIGAGQTVFALPESLVETDMNLFVTNTGPDYIEVSVGVGTSIARKNYILYNERIEPGQSISQTNVKLGPGEIIFAKSTHTTVNVVALGKTHE